MQAGDRQRGGMGHKLQVRGSGGRRKEKWGWEEGGRSQEAGGIFERREAEVGGKYLVGQLSWG